MVIAMTKVVLEVIALVFQRVERLIFNAPPCAPTPHELINRALIDAQVGNPTKVLDRVLGLVPLPALQKVDPQVGIGFIERHGTNKAKAMMETRPCIVSIVIGDSPSPLSRRHVLKQVGMVAFFDTENIVQVVILQNLDMRGI